jgi:FtsZ-binding cell division protein ZapB
MSLMTPDKLQEKVQNLSTRHARVLRRKAELGGELKVKREELESLVKEIQAAGYNPKTLVEERNRAQEELETLLGTFENNLVEAETILSEFDRK